MYVCMYEFYCTLHAFLGLEGGYGHVGDDLARLQTPEELQVLEESKNAVKFLTYIRTSIHTYIYTYMHTYINIYIRTYIHNMHTYIHTYIPCYI